ncbi:MAG TPA: DnaJ domain-containing protein [Streptosporangiaceae bacterium]
MTYGCPCEGTVMVMAAAGTGGPGPDLYQLLGVSREASREEIAQAWRRRARAEHPDSRPGDAAAPGRFRDLAGAWYVLGDPGRRAAYDQTLGHDQPPPAAPPVRVTRAAGRTPMMGTPGPPLRAGPVRVERPRGTSPPGGWDEEELILALALRYLARDWDRPW